MRAVHEPTGRFDHSGNDSDEAGDHRKPAHYTASGAAGEGKKKADKPEQNRHNCQNESPKRASGETEDGRNDCDD